MLRALWLLRDEEPLRCRLEGDDPASRDLASRLGVELHDGPGGLFVAPSVNADSILPYARALAAGIPAVGCRGEAGPERLAALTDAMVHVPPADPERLAKTIQGLMADEALRRRLGNEGRAAIAEHLSWAAP